VRVVVAPEAQVDIAEAYNSVAEDNSQAADRLLARVVEIIGLLAAKEFVGREVVLRDGRRVRTWPIPPYRVYYRERADVFEVVRVYHQSRRPIERQPRSRP
jgi:toxin ParE1/3/4